MRSAPLHIAIDGPAASGKTTVARRVAECLDVLYLDTGAMYRALAWTALRTQTHFDNEAALARLCRLHPIVVTLDVHASLGFRIRTGDRELQAAELDANEVTAVVSTVAAHPSVREAMVSEQRRIARGTALVMAGRDIGTVVLPDARVKIFLTASVAARAARRREQLQASGVDIDTQTLTEGLQERDRLDECRTVSPLRKAADATVIDSSALSVDEVVARVCGMAAAAA